MVFETDDKKIFKKITGITIKKEKRHESNQTAKQI